MEASASAINTEHPDAPPADDAEGFFGDMAEEQPVAAEPEAAPDPDPATFDPESGTFTAEEVEAKVAAEAPAVEETPAPAEAPVADTNAPPPAAEVKKRGNVDREYRVFHRLPLTEKALTFLLSQIQEGRAPKPRVAWFEVEALQERNAVRAIGKVYTDHASMLGSKAHMAAVSSASFQEKDVAPKERPVETTLSIT